MFLDELKRGEENGVDETGSTHGNAQTAIHVPSEELNLHGLDLVSSGVGERVSLIDALCRVDGVCDR